MAALNLRALGAFDLDLLAALHAEAFTAPWDRPWSPKSFAEVLAMPGAAGLLATVADQPVGFGLTLQALDEVELLLIALLPQQRGKGYAGTLLAALLAQATDATRALLEVAASNTAAIACYQRAGFTPCGRRRAYYPGAIDALLFEKLL